MQMHLLCIPLSPQPQAKSTYVILIVNSATSSQTQKHLAYVYNSAFKLQSTATIRIFSLLRDIVAFVITLLTPKLRTYKSILPRSINAKDYDIIRC